MVDAGDTRDRRLLVCTPLAYVAQVLADQVLTGGGTVVLLDGFDPAEVLATIEAQRITHLGLVEPGLVELIDHPDLPRRDLSSLVAISHIGADAPANLRRRLLARAGSVLANPYGASEAGIISVLAPPEYGLEHPELLATAGRPLPAVEVRIERPDGSEARPGEAGAIVIRSAAAADGYDVDPTRSSFGDHYRTGDLGFLDADGYLHVRGRLKDARTIEGETVMPIDVANALCGLAHPLNNPLGLIHLPIAQDELAAIAGVSRQRCNLALQHMQAEGWLHVGYGQLTLLALEPIAGMARAG